VAYLLAEINLSHNHFGGPFFEGDDPIEIDPEIVERLEHVS